MKSVDFDAMFSVQPRSEARREVDSRDDFDLEPLTENSFGEFGDFQLVGHGKVTNDNCGRFRGFNGCDRVDLHNRITVDGQNFTNKVYVRKVFYSCDKPSCPTCYKYGWAVREARHIEGRLAKASKRFGLVEHIVASVPPRDYGLSLEDLRKKVVKVLKSRGVVGGVLIFHAFRYNVRDYWYWSPHFHVLGFILGGYSRCRNCKRKWNCLAGCGGFDDRSYQNFLKDGYYVKVLGKRKTVGGTAWYQLNHASIDVTKKRFHVATWFGVCSYRKLKLTVEAKKRVCPICQHDLRILDYHGIKTFVLNKDSPDFRRESYEDYMENGRVVWVAREPREAG